MERLGVDLNATGSVMTRRELEDQRRKRGECLTCGRKCFQKKLFKMVPITDHGRVLEGRCLNCKPLEIASDNTVLPAVSRPATNEDMERFRTSQRNVHRAREGGVGGMHGSMRHHTMPPGGGGPGAGHGPRGMRDRSGPIINESVMEEDTEGRTGRRRVAERHPSSGADPPRARRPQPPPARGGGGRGTPRSASLDMTMGFAGRTGGGGGGGGAGGPMEVHRTVEDRTHDSVGSGLDARGDRLGAGPAQSAVVAAFAAKRIQDNFRSQHAGSANGEGLDGGRERSSQSVVSEGSHERKSAGHDDEFLRSGILDRGGVVNFDGHGRKCSMSSAASSAVEPQEEDLFASGRAMSPQDASGGGGLSSSRKLPAKPAPANEAERQALAVVRDPGATPEAIAEVMRSHLASALVQEESFRALSELHLGPEDLSRLDGLGVSAAVVAGMGAHRTSARVQSAACRALWNLSAAAEGQESIGGSGGVEAIVGAMSEFESDAEVQETALAALSNLGAADRNQPLIQDAGGIQEIVLAMNRFSENIHVQETGCAALTNLASKDSSVKAAITEAGGADAVVISMVMHPGDVELQQKALRALRNLCANDDDNKILVANVGGIDAVIGAMQVHRDDAAVQEAGAWTLSNLAVNAENKAIIGESGGIDVIVRAMWVHSDHAGVQEWACRALWTLSVDPNNREIVTEVGGISAVVNAMQAHVDAAAVQEKGCGVLANLAANDDNNKIRIVEEEALDAIVMAMVLHGDDRLVQERACTVLRKLAYGPNIKPMQAANVAALMQAAATKFPEQCKEKTDYVLSMM